MVAFLLSMPHVASWNNKWSGEGKIYARLRRDNEVPAEYIDQSFEYRWNDGWGASVEVKKVDAKEAAKIRKCSAGFYGYDWMIDSIIDHGKIITPEDFIEQEGTDEQKFIADVAKYTGVSTNKDFTEIHNASFNKNNLKALIEHDVLNEDTEIYNGGPTIAEIIKFMTKYDEEIYTIDTIVKNKTFYFTSMSRNAFCKKNIESQKEIKQLLRGAEEVSNEYFKDEVVYKFRGD